MDRERAVSLVRSVHEDLSRRADEIATVGNTWVEPVQLEEVEAWLRRHRP